MRRLHLFEFEDQPWLPASLRDPLLEFLQYQITSFRLYAPAVGKLRDAVEESGCHQLLDIGSGGGETALQVQHMLAERGCTVSLTLTDRYPPAPTVARVNRGGTPDVRYVPEPVDALRLPGELKGLRLFLTSFHHFAPTQAAAILQQAVDDGVPIAVFEFTERTPSNLAGMLLSPLAVLASMRRLRPRTLAKTLWTYVVPVLPLLYWWDGTVSHLRTYTVAELSELIPAGNDFLWDVGQKDGDGYRVTYLVGIPKAPRLPRRGRRLSREPVTSFACFVGAVIGVVAGDLSSTPRWCRRWRLEQKNNQVRGVGRAALFPWVRWCTCSPGGGRTRAPDSPRRGARWPPGCAGTMPALRPTLKATLW